VLLAPICPDFQ